MSSAEYIEREIASSREVYNSICTEFNKWLFTWPTRGIAGKKHLHTLPLYIASVQQRQDVSLKMDL
jgi:LemA protein